MCVCVLHSLIRLCAGESNLWSQPVKLPSVTLSSKKSPIWKSFSFNGVRLELELQLQRQHHRAHQPLGRLKIVTVIRISLVRFRESRPSLHLQQGATPPCSSSSYKKKTTAARFCCCSCFSNDWAHHSNDVMKSKITQQPKAKICFWYVWITWAQWLRQISQKVSLVPPVTSKPTQWRCIYLHTNLSHTFKSTFQSLCFDWSPLHIWSTSSTTVCALLYN